MIFLTAVLSAAPSPSLAAGAFKDSLVLLNVTFQEYLQQWPWEKAKEASRSGYGVVISEGRVLCTAELIRDATLIRAAKSDDYDSYPAEIATVDWDVNLALLKVEDGGFFSGLAPVELEPDVSLEQPVVFAVMERTRELRSFPGQIVNATVTGYPLSAASFLTLGASVNFEGRPAGFGEPAWADGRLVGLAMSYDDEGKFARLIPAAVIRRFLEAVEKGYPGPPALGFFTAPAINPALKEWLGLSPEQDGVYIRSVHPGSPADGLVKRGDILTRIGEEKIDSGGFYQHPRWGRLDFPDLVYRNYRPGEELEVEIWRDGEPLRLKIPLQPLREVRFLIPPYSFEPPRYMVVGGLVIQELTGEYLRSWGREWQHQANKKFLYYYSYENHSGAGERERMIFVNRVLPAEINIGYQDLGDVVVEEINGRKIRSFSDVEEALGKPEGGFHRIRLEEFNREVILPVEGLEEADAQIAREYGRN